MPTRLHAYMLTCLHACPPTYLPTYRPIWLHLNPHICLHAYTATCQHTYMHTCLHAHMPIWLHTNPHSCLYAFGSTCRRTDLLYWVKLSLEPKNCRLNPKFSHQLKNCRPTWRFSSEPKNFLRNPQNLLPEPKVKSAEAIGPVLNPSLQRLSPWYC